MTPDPKDDPRFNEAVQGLERGDFSRLDPLFTDDPREGGASPIVRWYNEGRFRAQPKALAEALSCACFNGRVGVARVLLEAGVDPEAGNATGMNAVHWAANRGRLEALRMLIAHGVQLEAKNMYGGTVLGCAVWSALHEPKPAHGAIIQVLLDAGARLDAVQFPTGNAAIDALLERARAGTSP
jgi:hypothetical protein